MIFSRIVKFLYRKYKVKSSYITIGEKSNIFPPFRIDGGKNISIGKNTNIREYAWLAAYNLTGTTPRLSIGDFSRIGYNSHIICTKSIIIENSVSIANSVYISDNLHTYEDINIPIIQQPISQAGEVLIGEGSWIGEHACIIGAKVGKHCVIGANAVVTRDIPDYSVAVGIPAKVIKKYDFNAKSWQKVD